MEERKEEFEIESERFEVRRTRAALPLDVSSKQVPEIPIFGGALTQCYNDARNSQEAGTVPP